MSVSNKEFSVNTTRCVLTPEGGTSVWTHRVQQPTKVEEVLGKIINRSNACCTTFGDIGEAVAAHALLVLLWHWCLFSFLLLYKGHATGPALRIVPPQALLWSSSTSCSHFLLAYQLVTTWYDYQRSQSQESCRSALPLQYLSKSRWRVW